MKILDASANNLKLTLALAQQISSAMSLVYPKTEEHKTASPDGKLKIFINDILYENVSRKEVFEKQVETFNASNAFVEIQPPLSVRASHLTAEGEKRLGKVNVIIDRLGALWHEADAVWASHQRYNVIDTLNTYYELLEKDGVLIIDAHDWKDEGKKLQNDAPSTSTLEMIKLVYKLDAPEEVQEFFKQHHFYAEEYKGDEGNTLLILRKEEYN